MSHEHTGPLVHPQPFGSTLQTGPSFSSTPSFHAPAQKIAQLVHCASIISRAPIEAKSSSLYHVAASSAVLL